MSSSFPHFLDCEHPNCFSNIREEECKNKKKQKQMNEHDIRGASRTQAANGRSRERHSRPCFSRALLLL